MPGTLYVVATPIGNLGDLSARAVEVLRTAELIAAEDTRHTRILLARHGITTPMTSFYDAIERRKTPELIAKLRAGAWIALVSDAGTPGIADPGGYLVPQVIAAGIPVVAIPGPCAALAALVVSGLPMERFVFEGYLPVKVGKLRRQLESLRGEGRTIVCYETPHRLLKHLAAIREILGDISMSVARELTKHFEEIRRGVVSEHLAHFQRHPPKGEFVLVFRAEVRTPWLLHAPGAPGPGQAGGGCRNPSP